MSDLEPEASWEAVRQALREAAFRLLARREHSQRELMLKLQRLFPTQDPEEIRAVLEGLAEDGYQSDARRQASLVRQAEVRGQGPSRLAAKLREAGLPPPDETEGEESVFARLQALQAQRFSGPPEDARGWQKQARFFAYRGFPPSLIRRLLGDLPWPKESR
jgi:Uncharacterized protein conserved in bacteria